MNNLNAIKEKLLKEKDLILLKQSTEDIDISGDETDVVQANFITGMMEKLSLRDKSKVNQIDEALSRIAAGTFGICVDCEENISYKRLEFNPHFSTCIFCAEKREKGI